MRKNLEIENVKYKAIKNKYPDSRFYIDGNKLVWNDENVDEPTEDEINSFIKELEEQYVKNEYQRLRKAGYDKLNQDEMRYDDEINGTTTWIDTIKAIKEKYPKPE